MISRRTSRFSDCCFSNQERPDVKCIAPDDSFSDCDKLIKSEPLRYIAWFVLVFIFGGNVLVMALRKSHEDPSYVQNIFIQNLNIGDTLMGVYLAGMVNRDLTWRDEYYLHDHEWRSGVACKILGAIALTSSEVCVLTLALIAYDRHAKVVKNMLHDPMEPHTARLLVGLIWFISISISVFPAVIKSYFYDEEKSEGYYGTNGLCFPLQLPGEKDPAWEYCLAIFGVLNFLVACYMVVVYCKIFYASYVSARESMKMGFRFVAIILTDILCWFSIATLIYMSLGGIVSDAKNNLYAWFSICVATINSAINPFIYTITTDFFWPKFNTWFKKIAGCRQSSCCKFGATFYICCIYNNNNYYYH